MRWWVCAALFCGFLVTAFLASLEFHAQYGGGTTERILWVVTALFLVLTVVFGAGGSWAAISGPGKTRVAGELDLVESPVSTPVAPVSPTKKMAMLSPKELVRLYGQGATEMQSDALVAQYIRQWRKVSMVVATVKQHNDVVADVSGKDADDTHITLFFKPDDWADRLRGLMPSDRVTALGRILSVSALQVVFHECELAE